MLPFGETVLLWRMSRGLTQQALARAARITRPNLSAIERGQREVTLGTLRALACALDVRPGVLADGQSPYGDPWRLPRNRLERIARAVASGTTLRDGRENTIVACLRQVSYPPGPGDEKRRRRTSDHATSLAYLKLKAMVPAETMTSLLGRVVEHREMT